MADGIFPSVISKDRDDNVIGNPIFVQISDGVEIIEVNADGSINIGSIIPGVGATDLGKEEDEAHTSGDTGVQVLAVRNDTLASLVTTDGDYAPLQVDADGALYVTGSFTTTSAEVIVDDTAFTPAVSSVAMSGFFVDETATDSVDEGDGGAARMTADRKQLIVLVDSTTDANRLTINSDGSVNVNLVNAVIAGEIHDYDTAAAVASDATDNHDYSVAVSTFLLKSVILAGSGNVKAEIQVGPIAGLVTVAVVFLTGKEGDTQQVFFDPAVEVPLTGTGTVRVIRTNRQGAATDVYSTIIGNQL
jgi:hypothetical protein